VLRSNNAQQRPVIEPIDWLRPHQDDHQRFVSPDARAPIGGLVRGVWRELILERDTHGRERALRQLSRETGPSAYLFTTERGGPARYTDLS
jgi:hypothetical protein